MLIDILVTVTSFILAYVTRNSPYFDKYGSLYEFSQYLWIFWIIVPTWPLILRRFGLYEDLVGTHISTIIGSLIKSVTVGSLILATALYMTKNDLFSRLLFVWFMIYDFGFLLTEKLIIRHIIKRSGERGDSRRIVLVSTQEGVIKFSNLLGPAHEELRMGIIGYFTIDQSGRPVDGIDCIGPIRGFRNFILEKTVDEVIFILPREYIEEMEEYILDCEEMGITVHMLLDIYRLTLAKTRVSYFGNIPLLTFYTVSLDENALFIKRIIDIIGSIIGLIIAGIIFIIFGPLIKLESEGPIIYSQPRVGKNGRVFKFYKFRTMYADADERKKELEHLNVMEGAMFKIEDDPRITKIGGFMRKLSLDEFPQFWNVLKGDMSLVGTRPPTLDEVEQYELRHWRRLSTKPGITGLWQISGRNEITDFDEVVELDVKYIDNWSLGLDIKILAKTVGSVFKKTGM